jgi:hypothetical protein
MKPITEGINKTFVHIPTGRLYTGYDVEDILWTIEKERERAISRDRESYSAEEFTELYV